MQKEDLGEENPRPDMLVVPAKDVVGLVGTEGLTIDLDVAEVRRVPGGPMQPCRSP